ncbi:MAG: FCD domain-containing protein [Agrobacterium sp.]|nr:FCD domain-containing protein [Agrobacterium sp.]
MSHADPLRETILGQLASDGQWRAGDRLPTERDLAERYSSVSRTTVRKALADFEAAGSDRPDRGQRHPLCRAGRHAPGPAHPARLVAPHTSPAELMEARLALEPAIIDLVMRNATSADLERMLTWCEQAEAARSLEEFEHWDGELHQAIAEAAHNSFVSSVFKLMNQARAQGEWGLLKKRSLTPERRLAYQREHRAPGGTPRGIAMPPARKA